MALSSSDVMRLLDSLRTADGVATIRVLCERILPELTEAEATEAISAAPGEQSDQHTTWRNAHRDRLLTTQAGDLDLKIPRVRTGPSFPSLPERLRRVHGVSTRSVDDLVKALGANSGTSKSECRGSAANSPADRQRSRSDRWTTPSSPPSSGTRPTARPG